jgi:predicted enzyme related to lactoylglutathione lyase
MMTSPVKYVHTNLVATDWRRLARFYVEVFGCEIVPPERSLAGEWLDAATGIGGVRIEGAHLRLPGHGDGGPTLEIFQYAPGATRAAGGPNCPGFGHIAFAVEDVPAAREAALAAGGGVVGEVVTVEIAGAGEITFVYLTDPEGNMVELQSWRRSDV